MLFPLEALLAHATNVRPLGAVAELVPLQVLLALEAGAANVANVPPLNLVHRQMLFEISFFRVRHLALGTAEQYRAVECGRDVHLAGLRWLRFRRLLLVLPLLLHFAVGVRGFVVAAAAAAADYRLHQRRLAMRLLLVVVREHQVARLGRPNLYRLQ